MSEIEVFQFPATGDQVRTAVHSGEPWFVARDVCDVLGIGQTGPAVAGLDEDEVTTTHLTDALGRRQETYLVSEAGLYSLILRSRKPEARAFKRWITHEVLPAIRRTGQYQPANMSRAELARSWYEAELRAEQAEGQLAIAAPKASAFDAFMDADGYYSFEAVAKMLHAETGLGRNNLIKRLRALGVLTDRNLPYQQYAHHFHVVASFFERADGRRETTYTTKVRATGVEFIRRKLGLGQGVLVTVDQAA